MGEHIQISKYVNADMKQVISELKNNEWYFFEWVCTTYKTAHACNTTQLHK